MSDVLLECAQSYKKLMDFEYQFKLNLSGEIIDYKLAFSKAEFKHLVGLEKLSDLLKYTKLSSEKILDNILSNKITYSSLCESSQIDDKINGASANNIEYFLYDRIMELTQLKNYFAKITNHNINIYKWDKSTSSNKRPNHSEISADILMVFSNKSFKKIDSEKTCAFFIKTRRDICRGVSIFPTDISYSNDGKIKLSEYKILSTTEICKSTGKSTTLIQCTPEELRKAQEASLRKDQSITIKNDLKSLKSKRNDYVSKPDEKTRTAYKKRLSIFQNRNIYTFEMLEIVADRLKAQLDDPHNCAVSETIKNEIEYIKNEAEQRRKEPDSPTEKSISIVKNQINSDGTISSETAAEIPIPNVKKISQKAQRNTHTVVGSINSFISDLKDFFNVFKKPKKQTPAKKKTSSGKPKSSVKTVNKNVSQQRKNPTEISKKVQENMPEKSVHNTPEKPADRPYFTREMLKKEAARISREYRENPRPKKEKSHSHEIE